MSKCGAIGCKISVDGIKAYCKSHWFQLPKLMRDEIWAAYRTKDRDASLRAIKTATKWLQENSK